MGLIETLAKSGQPSGPSSRVFFNTHPGLLDEVLLARAAGWSWRQITAVLRTDYGWPLSHESLRRFVERV